ncbi:diguanylate cyclase [bacterium]|nr:diguanylate cyclase [bacterium]MBU1995342.1 diguanylate cyclase [bacterium]
MNLSVKNKTLLFTVLVIFVFASIILGLIYVKQKDTLIETQKEYFENVKYLYSKVKSKHENFYINWSLLNLESMGIKEAFYNQNREELYKLSHTIWNTLQKENKDLALMSFHMPDGTVFLRMHDIDNFGDNVSNSRTMVRKVHIKKNVLFGFESFSNNLAYRIFQPIFYKEKYIGALEFGLRPDYILNDVNYYHKVDGALFVKNTEQNGFLKKTSKINDFVLQYNVLLNEKLLTYFPENYNFESFININTPDGDTWSVYSFDLKDFNNDVAAKVIFFKDITNDILEFKNSIINLTIILMILTVIVFVVVNIGFNSSIRNLERKYIDVSAYKNMVDENVLIYSIDLNGIILDVSDAFCRICGFSQKELIGKSFEVFAHPELSKEFFTKIWESLKYKKTWTGDVKNLKNNGKYYWTHVNIQPRLRENLLVGYDVIMHDITDKKINEELLVTDGLTHIYNRRYFNDIFPRMIKSAQRDGGYLSFLILDVDNFKLYNDTYGHQAGDKALIAVANVLNESLNRGDDFCFRLGGEEFGVLYKSSNEEDAYLFAQKFRKNIMALNIQHEKNENEGVLTASFGLVSLKGDELLSNDEMYKIADEYLYRAKKEGRNRVVSKLV